MKQLSCTLLNLTLWIALTRLAIDHGPPIFTAQLFWAKLFSSPQLWHCPCSHCENHKAWVWPPVHTLLLQRVCKAGEKPEKLGGGRAVQCSRIVGSSHNPRSSHKCTKASANKDLSPVSKPPHSHTDKVWKMYKKFWNTENIDLTIIADRWVRIDIPKLGGLIICVHEKMLTVAEVHVFHLNRWITKLAQTLYNVLPKADQCQNDYNILPRIRPNKITWPIFCWWMSAQYVSLINW